MDPEQQYPGRRKSSGSPFFILLAVAAFLALLAFIVIDIRESDDQGPIQIGTDNDLGNSKVLTTPEAN